MATRCKSRARRSRRYLTIVKLSGAETGTQLESITNEAPLQTDEPCYNRRRP